MGSELGAAHSRSVNRQHATNSTSPLPGDVDVLIVGAGHAGLAMSGLLTTRAGSTWSSSAARL